jgi:hypothetical protein
VNYVVRQKVPDVATHAFGPQFNYDTLVKSQMSEFNNAYLAAAILKATMWVTIQLKNYQIKDKHSSSVDNYYPRPPDLSYLWHYSYEKDSSKIACSQDYIDKNCLQYIRRFPRSNTIKHKIVWNYKPKKYYIPDDNKLENVTALQLLQKTDVRPTMHNRVVRFGPVLNGVTDQEFIYNFDVKEHIQYKIGLTGRRSVCPGFASLKEKPAGWKRLVKDKQV